MEMGLRAAKKNCWLFYGDAGSMYKSIDSVPLWLNGTIYADTAYREDCFIGKEMCIKLLESGGSIAI